VTACQQACPSPAITFGNINDPKVAGSRSSRPTRATTRCSAELNTPPRTTYLAAVRNPNPALPSNPTVGGHHAESHDAASTESEH
jgi:Fe-S-cluster-containing dehydrogenase component